MRPFRSPSSNVIFASVSRRQTALLGKWPDVSLNVFYVLLVGYKNAFRYFSRDESKEREREEKERRYAREKSFARSDRGQAQAIGPRFTIEEINESERGGHDE